MEPDIQNIANEIKKYFYDFKRQQLGKPYAPAERMRKPEIWAAAAELCVVLKADPFNFVKAASCTTMCPAAISHPDYRPGRCQVVPAAPAGYWRQWVDAAEVTAKRCRIRSARSRLVSGQTRRTWKQFLMDDTRYGRTLCRRM